ncbi:MAG: hypothetical protein U0269_31425 [Polyangiales bacterium]
MAEKWEELFARWQEQAFAATVIATSTSEYGFREAITRWLTLATPEQRAEVTRAIGERISSDWTAAVALAVLGERSYTPAILDAMKKATDLPFDGYTVAIETMRDEAAVPALMAMLEARDPKRAWGLEKALKACTGRAPLVDRCFSPELHAAAVLAAWKRPPLAAPTLRIAQRAARWATFGLDHGGGEIRIENTPYNGGSWPRWSRALYVNDAALYDVSSGCGTCRTILQLAGKLADHTSLDRYRAALGAIDTIEYETLTALLPLIGRLQTSHYLASLVDLAIERVDDSARSWLANYYPADADLAGGNDGVDFAPRTTHFQSRERGPESALSTFCVLVPGQDLAKLDEARVSEYEAAIREGARPAVIALTWVEDRLTNWDGTDSVRALLGVILDGHHKLAAYARAKIPARLLTITNFDASTCGETEPEDAVHEAIAALTAA